MSSSIDPRNRSRALPLLAGLIGKCVVVGLVVTGVLMLIGALAYDVSLPLSHLPALLFCLVAGSAAFCCMGRRLHLVDRL